MPENIDGIYLNAYITEGQVNANINRDREIVYVTDWNNGFIAGDATTTTLPNFTPIYEIDFQGIVYRRNIVTWEALNAVGGAGLKYAEDGDTLGVIRSTGFDEHPNRGAETGYTEGEFSYILGDNTRGEGAFGNFVAGYNSQIKNVGSNMSTIISNYSVIDEANQSVIIGGTNNGRLKVDVKYIVRAITSDPVGDGYTTTETDFFCALNGNILSPVVVVGVTLLEGERVYSIEEQDYYILSAGVMVLDSQPDIDNIDHSSTTTLIGGYENRIYGNDTQGSSIIGGMRNKLGVGHLNSVILGGYDNHSKSSANLIRPLNSFITIIASQYTSLTDIELSFIASSYNTTITNTLVSPSFAHKSIYNTVISSSDTTITGSAIAHTIIGSEITNINTSDVENASSKGYTTHLVLNSRFNDITGTGGKHSIINSYSSEIRTDTTTSADHNSIFQSHASKILEASCASISSSFFSTIEGKGFITEDAQLTNYTSITSTLSGGIFGYGTGSNIASSFYSTIASAFGLGQVGTNVYSSIQNSMNVSMIGYTSFSHISHGNYSSINSFAADVPVLSPNGAEINGEFSAIVSSRNSSISHASEFSFIHHSEYTAISETSSRANIVNSVGGTITKMSRASGIYNAGQSHITSSMNSMIMTSENSSIRQDIVKYVVLSRRDSRPTNSELADLGGDVYFAISVNWDFDTINKQIAKYSRSVNQNGVETTSWSYYTMNTGEYIRVLDENVLNNGSVNVMGIGRSYKLNGTTWDDIELVYNSYNGIHHSVQSNITNSAGSIIMSGAFNNINSFDIAKFNAIMSGENNLLLVTGFSTIVAGARNTIIAPLPDSAVGYSTILNGEDNFISGAGSYQLIGGGLNNTIKSPDAAILHGQLNVIADSVEGGYGGDVSSSFANISGGIHNKIYGSPTAHIGGGLSNIILGLANASVIAGGSTNLIGASGYSSFIGGGQHNILGELPLLSTNKGASVTLLTNTINIGVGYSSALAREPKINDTVRFTENISRGLPNGGVINDGFRIDNILMTPEEKLYIVGVDTFETGFDANDDVNIGTNVIHLDDGDGLSLGNQIQFNQPNDTYFDAANDVNILETFSITLNDISGWRTGADIRFTKANPSDVLPTPLLEGVTYKIGGIDTLNSSIYIRTYTGTYTPITAIGSGIVTVTDVSELPLPLVYEEFYTIATIEYDNITLDDINGAAIDITAVGSGAIVVNDFGGIGANNDGEFNGASVNLLTNEIPAQNWYNWEVGNQLQLQTLDYTNPVLPAPLSVGVIYKILAINGGSILLSDMNDVAIDITVIGSGTIELFPQEVHKTAIRVSRTLGGPVGVINVDTIESFSISYFEDIGHIRSLGSVIAGGSDNYASQVYTVIGGGVDNIINDSAYGVIGGGRENIITGYDNPFSTILSGYRNKLNSITHGTILSGRDNTITDSEFGGAAFANIRGGHNNTIVSAWYSQIGVAQSSTIGSTDYDKETRDYLDLGYVSGNVPSSYATIVSGQFNRIFDGPYAFIGGGHNNSAWGIFASYGFIGNGLQNRILSADNGFIGNGAGNRVGNTQLNFPDCTLYDTGGSYKIRIPKGGISSGDEAVIFVGEYIYVGTSGGTPSSDIEYDYTYYYISSVTDNITSTDITIALHGPESTIIENVILDPGVGASYEIATGNSNTYGTIVNGDSNSVSSSSGFIGTGDDNIIGVNSSYAVIDSGLENTIQRASESFIGTGYKNTIINTGVAAILSGENNFIGNDEFDEDGVSSGHSTIINGDYNTINGVGRYQLIGGGYRNSISGDVSMSLNSRFSRIYQNNGIPLTGVVNTFNSIMSSQSAIIDLGGGASIYNSVMGSNNSGFVASPNQFNYIYASTVSSSFGSWISNTSGQGKLRASQYIKIDNSSNVSAHASGDTETVMNEIEFSTNSVLGANGVVLTDTSVFSDSGGTLAITLLSNPFNADNIVFMPPMSDDTLNNVITGITYGEQYALTLVSGTTYEIGAISYGDYSVTGDPQIQYLFSISGATKSSISHSDSINISSLSTDMHVKSSNTGTIINAVGGNIVGSNNFLTTGGVRLNVINGEEFYLAGCDTIFGANIIGNGSDITGSVPIIGGGGFVSLFNVNGSTVQNSNVVSLLNSNNDSVISGYNTSIINGSDNLILNSNTSAIFNGISNIITDTVNTSAQPLSAIVNAQYSLIDVQGTDGTGNPIYNIQYLDAGQGGPLWSITVRASDIGALTIGGTFSTDGIDGTFPIQDLSDYPQLNGTHTVTNLVTSIDGTRTDIYFTVMTANTPASSFVISTTGTLGDWLVGNTPPTAFTYSFGNTIIGSIGASITGISSYNTIMSSDNGITIDALNNVTVLGNSSITPVADNTVYLENLTIGGTTLKAVNIKSGTDQVNASAIVGEIWVDTANGNVLKLGV